MYSYKSRKTALLLALFFGDFGLHRFYVGKIGTGALYLLTGGLFGIGSLVDFILICMGRFTDKYGNRLMNDVSPTFIVVIIAIVVLLAIIGAIIGAVSGFMVLNDISNAYI